MKIHFVSGLPRSGSTLLCNILAQNPRFNATSTSGIIDVMFLTRNSWKENESFKASPNKEGLKRVLKAILTSYHEGDKPVVFDKSRGWTSQIEMLEEVLGEKVKIIVPIRDLRQVLSSFEKIWRKTSKLGQMGQERSNFFAFQNIKTRTQVWLDVAQPLGLAYNRIQDAIQRGYRDRLHFVDFDHLTKNPKEALKGIHDFLGEEYFEYDFDNVQQVTVEDDGVYGIEGLHDIRPKVEPQKEDWKEILGEWADEYKNFNIK